MRTVHVITPGDHFSPRTGSAIATVVHGLCSHAGAETQSAVAVAVGTYPDHYTSARVYEYEQAPPVRLPPGVWPNLVDATAARLGLPRPLSRRRLAAAVRDQSTWPGSVVLGHNAPQLVPLVDRDRHRPFLYAHNDVLKTYTTREAGRVLGSADGIICVSAFLAERTQRRLPARLRDRVRVVHNGADLRLFRRTAPLRSSDLLEIVFVGRMIPEKGADVLLEAMHRLRRNDIRLTLVGSRGFTATDLPSRYERTVRRRAAALGSRVSIRPFLPPAEVAHILASSDVLVVPSRWPEPFALTVREGQAAGMAVVAADVGGIPEALGPAGVLVPPDDPRALADVLAGLADDERWLRRLGASARAFAVEHDWSAASTALGRAVAELTRA